MKLKNYIKFYNSFAIKKKITAPEGFITRVFLSKNPVQFLKDYKFRGKTLLDYSCGEGRNINFFKSLGMKVEGSEIDKSIILKLKQKFKKTKFFVSSFSTKMSKFKKYDYVAAVNCVYYLEKKHGIENNLLYLKKFMKKNGCLIVSFIGKKHYVLNKCQYYKKNYAIIRKDNFNFKNGLSVFVVRDIISLKKILAKCGLKLNIFGEIKDISQRKTRHLIYCTCTLAD